MSGPKVIRIVTREEIIAIQQRNLARLDVAITQWTNACRTANALNDGDLEAVKKRRSDLHSLLNQDRFNELQKSVTQELVFLQADAKARRAKAAEAAARVRREDRRTNSVATTLLDTLKEANVKIPEDILLTLRRARGGSSELASAISKGFSLLVTPSVPDGVTGRQREIASALRDEQPHETLEEWIEKHAPRQKDNVALQIDEAIADLLVHEGKQAAVPFEAREAAIAEEPSFSRRALLKDSLLLDLAVRAKERRQHQAWLSDMLELSAELKQFRSDRAEAVVNEIEALIKDRAVAGAPDLIKRATSLLASEERNLASLTRRRAILQGLSSLGYDVEEGMATAWVQDGRVLLRKAATPDYGIELGEGSASERFQARVVRFGSADTATDAARDQDMETIWCNELDQLLSTVSNAGGEAAIERAFKAGELPVKVVPLQENEAEWDAGLPAQRTRSIE